MKAVLDWLSAAIKHYGWLLLAALPLLIYELVAVFTKKIPTISASVTRTFKSNPFWFTVLPLGFAILMIHFFAGWPG